MCQNQCVQGIWRSTRPRCLDTCLLVFHNNVLAPNNLSCHVSFKQERRRSRKGMRDEKPLQLTRWYILQSSNFETFTTQFLYAKPFSFAKKSFLYRFFYFGHLTHVHFKHSGNYNDSSASYFESFRLLHSKSVSTDWIVRSVSFQRLIPYNSLCEIHSTKDCVSFYWKSFLVSSISRYMQIDFSGFFRFNLK